MMDLNTPGGAWAGDNRTLEQQAADAAEAALDPLRARLKILTTSIAKLTTIGDGKRAGDVTDTVAMFQQLADDVTAAHEKTKAPWKAAVEAIDGPTATLRLDLYQDKRRLESMLLDWQVSEKGRIEAERAVERQEEADDPEPSVVPHELIDTKTAVTVRGTRGAKAHLQEHHIVESVDVTKLEPEFLKSERVMEAIKSEAVRRRWNSTPTAGVVFGTGMRTQVRR